MSSTNTEVQQKVLYESAVLSAGTKKGGTKFWCIWAYADETGAYTQSKAWQSTKDGESTQVISAPTKVEGKNQGKKNETTPEQQAVLEAQAEERKKKERKGYLGPGETKPEGVYRAMKALMGKWADNKHNIGYPAACQPKYDGHRMTFDGSKGWSREANPVVQACIQHLAFDTGGVILDGEIMLPHDEFDFEDTTSAAKKFDPELSPKLVYFVYDIVDEELTFKDRHAKLTAMASQFPERIRLAPTRIVDSEEAVMEAFGEFRLEGHEGAMVRNLDGAYLQNHRSSDLVKVKEMDDGEFQVVGVKEGTGKFVGIPIFLLQDKDGADRGEATPKGSFPAKRAMWAKRHDLIGKTVTVKYQGFTKHGKLRFGVVHRIREDL